VTASVPCGFRRIFSASCIPRRFIPVPPISRPNGPRSIERRAKPWKQIEPRHGVLKARDREPENGWMLRFAVTVADLQPTGTKSLDCHQGFALRSMLLGPLGLHGLGSFI
jgi:hypothetical protein